MKFFFFKSPFRFEQKKWFRYDDTVVTETLENFVRTSKNGYIMMYVWEGLVSKYLDSEPHRSSSPLSESLSSHPSNP